MDFNSVLAELRSAASDFGKSTAQISVATAQFCHRACKVLDKVVKSKDTFENQVINVWIVIGSINELLSQLADGSILSELCDKLFRQCARMVLDIQWQQLDEDSSSRQNFQTSLATCHDIMTPRGYSRFGLLQGLMDMPWTDPTLTLVMGDEEDNDEGEGLVYIQAQDPEILKLRIEMMFRENCDEFALNLCCWSLKHPAIQHDLSVRRTQFILLHRVNNVDRIQEECQHIGVEDSVKLINSLQDNEDAKELCTILAQTFLVQNWIKPSSDDSKKELLRIWLQHQYRADQDQDRFISSLWAVAKVSHCTEQLLFIIDGVKEQCGDAFIQFYTDLCVFALNVDKGCLEKLMKESGTSAPGEEAVARKRDMAKVCEKLSHIVAHVSPKVAFCCALTRFALQPSEETLKAMCDSYHRKTTAGNSSKSQCCSNCASDQGHCLKEADQEKEGRDLNIATLYEVERLCGMLRPAYLSADNEFNNLFALCKQYLRKETGEAMKQGLPALMRNQMIQSAPPVPFVAGSCVTTLSQSRPNILRGATSPVTQQASPSTVQNVLATNMPATKPTVAATVIRQPGVQVHTGQQLTSGPAVSTSLAARAQPTGMGLMHQLVMKQLSADTVQTLLHLIQSGQVTPQQLGQLLTSGNFTAQSQLPVKPATQTQLTTATAAVQKSAPPQSQSIQQQLQQQFLQHQRQRFQQQQQQELQQKQQQQQFQQLQQQLQQRQQVKPQQLQVRQQQAPPLQADPKQVNVKLGQAQVLESPAQQATAVRSPQQSLSHSSTAQHSQPSSFHLAASGAELSLQPRVMSNQLMLQQSQNSKPTRMQQPQQRLSVTGVQPVRPPLTGVRPIRPSLTTGVSLSGLQLGNISKPVHVMTVRQPSAVPSQVPVQNSQKGVRVVSAQPVVLHSHPHMSGGSLTSVQGHILPKPVVRLQPSLVNVTSGATAGPQSQTQTGSRLAQSASLPGSVVRHGNAISDGNRHYLINSLLFTGEEQNNALSIALPDTLPEISADSVSDTLRALNDSPSATQVKTKALQKPETSAPGLVGQGSVQSLSQNPSAVLQLDSVAASQKKPAQLAQGGQVTQVQAQPLPSIATLFGPNKQTLSSPVPVTTNVTKGSNGSVPSAGKQKAANQARSQKKVASGEKTGKTNKKDLSPKKEKDGLLVDKEALTLLLRQAMKLSMDQNPAACDVRAGTSYHTYIHEPARPDATLSGSDRKSGSDTKSQDFSPIAEPLPVFPQHLPQSRPPPISQPKVISLPEEAVRREAAQPPPSQSPLPVQTNTLAASIPSFLNSSGLGPSASSVPSLNPRPSAGPAVAQPIQLPGLAAASAMLPTPAVVPASSLHSVLLGDDYPAVNSSQTKPAVTGENSVLAALSPSLSSPVPRPLSFPSYSPHSSSCGLVTSAGSATPDVQHTAKMSTDSLLSTIPVKPEFAAEQPGIKEPQTTVALLPSETTADAEALTFSYVPEAGILEKTKTGDELSIATYRCIICAKAFVALDDLRLHVKQICRPGLAQPALGDRMAFNKAQATEAGLETSTVFQCMRCFELCISEQGIREHKLVCSKAAKPKSKAKPRSKTPKPKPPKSEDEAATEARVLELLNKCLDEHRQELESKGERCASQEGKSKRKKKKPAAEDSAPVHEVSGVKGEDGCLSLKQEVPGAALDGVSATSEGEKPKPKRKYYPKKKKEPESNITVKQDTDMEAGQKKSSKKKKEKEPPGPPSPKYKELSGSGGRSFYKCLNCNQTLCSIENFMDHWAECIIKKPPLPPRKRSVKKVSEKKDEKEVDDKKPVSADASIEDKIEENPVSGQETEEENVHDSEVMPDVLSEKGAKLDCISASGGDEESIAYTEFVSIEESVEGGMTKAPEAFEASVSDIINEMDVETSFDTEITTPSLPLLKESVVVLEKVDLTLSLTALCKKKTGTQERKCAQDEEFDKSARSAQNPKLKPVKRLHDRTMVQKRLRDRRKNRQGLPWFISESLRAKMNSSHSKSKVSSPVAENKTCHVCKMQFTKRQILIQHLAGKHVHPYTKRKLGDSASYFCHLCQKIYPHYTQYMAHVVCHAQAIEKKMEDMTSISFLATPGRSRRIANQRGVHGRSPKKHGRTSPKDLSRTGAGEIPRRGRGRPRKYPVDEGDRAAPKPSPVKDRRSSGRAAQKQALSKIYISSLGIPNVVEDVTEGKKRRLSFGEKDSDASSKSKLSKQRNKSGEFAGDKDSDKESSSSGTIETVDDRKDCNWEPETDAGDSDSISSVRHVVPRVRLEATKSTNEQEKASIDENAEQSRTVTNQNACIASNTSAAAGNANIITSPPLSSSHSPQVTASAVPKKPSFLDSFVSFISNRTAETPLILNRPRKRFTSTGDREADVKRTLAEMRRKSCETLPQKPQSFSPRVLPAATALAPFQPPLKLPSSPRSAGSKSPRASSPACADGKKEKGLKGVYYYGQFEEQLARRCSVHLGARMDPEEIDRLIQRPMSFIDESVTETIVADEEITKTAAAVPVVTQQTQQPTSLSISELNIAQDSRSADIPSCISDSRGIVMMSGGPVDQAGVNVVEIKVDKDIKVVLPSVDDVNQLDLTHVNSDTKALPEAMICSVSTESAETGNLGSPAELYTEGTLVPVVLDIVPQESVTDVASIQNAEDTLHDIPGEEFLPQQSTPEAATTDDRAKRPAVTFPETSFMHVPVQDVAAPCDGRSNFVQETEPVNSDLVTSAVNPSLFKDFTHTEQTQYTTLADKALSQDLRAENAVTNKSQDIAADSLKLESSEVSSGLTETPLTEEAIVKAPSDDAPLSETLSVTQVVIFTEESKRSSSAAPSVSEMVEAGGVPQSSELTGRKTENEQNAEDQQTNSNSSGQETSLITKAQDFTVREKESGIIQHKSPATDSQKLSVGATGAVVCGMVSNSSEQDKLGKTASPFQSTGIYFKSSSQQLNAQPGSSHNVTDCSGEKPVGESPCMKNPYDQCTNSNVPTETASKLICGIDDYPLSYPETVVGLDSPKSAAEVDGTELSQVHHVAREGNRTHSDSPTALLSGDNEEQCATVTDHDVDMSPDIGEDQSVPATSISSINEHLSDFLASDAFAQDESIEYSTSGKETSTATAGAFQACDTAAGESVSDDSVPDDPSGSRDAVSVQELPLTESTKDKLEGASSSFLLSEMCKAPVVSTDATQTVMQPSDSATLTQTASVTEHVSSHSGNRADYPDYETPVSIQKRMDSKQSVVRSEMQEVEVTSNMKRAEESAAVKDQGVELEDNVQSEQVNLDINSITRRVLEQAAPDKTSRKELKAIEAKQSDEKECPSSIVQQVEGGCIDQHLVTTKRIPVELWSTEMPGAADAQSSDRDGNRESMMDFLQRSAFPLLENQAHEQPKTERETVSRVKSSYTDAVRGNANVPDAVVNPQHEDFDDCMETSEDVVRIVDLPEDTLDTDTITPEHAVGTVITEHIATKNITECAAAHIFCKPKSECITANSFSSEPTASEPAADHTTTETEAKTILHKSLAADNVRNSDVEDTVTGPAAEDIYSESPALLGKASMENTITKPAAENKLTELVAVCTESAVQDSSPNPATGVTENVTGPVEHNVVGELKEISVTEPTALSLRADDSMQNKLETAMVHVHQAEKAVSSERVSADWMSEDEITQEFETETEEERTAETCVPETSEKNEPSVDFVKAEDASGIATPHKEGILSLDEDAGSSELLFTIKSQSDTDRVAEDADSLAVAEESYFPQHGEKEAETDVENPHTPRVDKTLSDTSLESEHLPELLIVTEPSQCKPVRLADAPTQTSDFAQKIGNMTLVTPTPPPTDKPAQETIVSAVCDNIEVQIVTLTKRKRAPVKTAAKTYTVSKTATNKEEGGGEEKPEEGEEQVVTTPVRKPLQGVKSLRNLITPEPFVWEMEGMEDPILQEKNQRAYKALKQRASRTPFTWDVEEGEKASTDSGSLMDSQARSAEKIVFSWDHHHVQDSSKDANSPPDTMLLEEAAASPVQEAGVRAVTRSKKPDLSLAGIKPGTSSVLKGPKESVSDTIILTPKAHKRRNVSLPSDRHLGSLVLDKDNEAVLLNADNSKGEPSSKVDEVPEKTVEEPASTSLTVELKTDTDMVEVKQELSTRSDTRRSRWSGRKRRSSDQEVTSTSQSPASLPTHPKIRRYEADNPIASCGSRVLGSTRMLRYGEEKQSFKESENRTPYSATNSKTSLLKGDKEKREKTNAGSSGKSKMQKTEGEKREGETQKKAKAKTLQLDDAKKEAAEPGFEKNNIAQTQESNNSPENREDPETTEIQRSDIEKRKVPETDNKVKGKVKLQRNDSRENREELEAEGKSKARLQRGRLEEASSTMPSSHTAISSTRSLRCSNKDVPEETKTEKPLEIKATRRGKMLRTGSKDSTESHDSGKSSRSQHRRDASASVGAENMARTLRSKESTPDIESVKPYQSKESTPDFDCQSNKPQRSKDRTDASSVLITPHNKETCESNSESSAKSLRSKQSPYSMEGEFKTGLDSKSLASTTPKSSRNRELAASLDLQKSVKMLRNKESVQSDNPVTPGNASAERRTRSRGIKNKQPGSSEDTEKNTKASTSQENTFVSDIKIEGKSHCIKDHTPDVDAQQTVPVSRSDNTPDTASQGRAKSSRSSSVRASAGRNYSSLSPLKKKSMSTAMKQDPPTAAKKEKLDIQPAKIVKEQLESDPSPAVSSKLDKTNQPQTEGRSRRPSSSSVRENSVSSPQDPSRRSRPKPEGPAMVRRRQGSSPVVSSNLLRKRPRMQVQPPQLEVIRVAPVSHGTPGKHPRTRSFDPSVRTVHTRISAEEYETVKSGHVKSTSDQKWLIDRQIGRVARKGLSRQHFPVGFSRVRSKTQKH